MIFFDLVLPLRYFAFFRDLVLCWRIGALGMNLQISDAFFLSCSFAIFSACFMNGVFLVIHCCIAVPVLCSQSSMSMLKGNLSCTKRVDSCEYNVLMRVSRANFVASLEFVPVPFP